MRLVDCADEMNRLIGAGFDRDYFPHIFHGFLSTQDTDELEKLADEQYKYLERAWTAHEYHHDPGELPTECDIAWLVLGPVSNRILRQIVDVT